MYACPGRLCIVAAVFGAGLGLCAPALSAPTSTPASSADRPSLGEFLFGRTRAPAAPAVARYQVEDGGGSFVLDAEPGKPAFLKFEGSPEIWALHATFGPRGDVIYKNDMDEPVVRATHLGGLTLFTTDQPEGMPAAFMGQAAPPHMMLDMGPDVLWNIFVQASARASRIAEHLVVFEGPQDVTSDSAPVFADAAILVSQAFTRVGAKGKAGQGLVARFAKVEFNAGSGAAASARGRVVRITVCPDKGVAGRPSSQRIASVISRR